MIRKLCYVYKTKQGSVSPLSDMIRLTPQTLAVSGFVTTLKITKIKFKKISNRVYLRKRKISR